MGHAITEEGERMNSYRINSLLREPQPDNWLPVALRYAVPIALILWALIGYGIYAALLPVGGTDSDTGCINDCLEVNP